MRPKNNDQRHKTILKLLKAALNDDEHESWPLSRIIWRAGETGITEATPLIIKLADKKDPLQLYSCVWALGRLGDPAALPFLKEIHQQPQPSHIISLTEAAILNVSDEAALSSEIKRLQQTLPASLQQAIQTGGSFLETFISDLFTKFNQGSATFLVTLYLVSIKQDTLRSLLLKGLAGIPVKAGYFKAIRQIFKISEMLNDTAAYGILTKRLEENRAGYSSSYQYLDGKWVDVAAELKKEDSRLAFSQKTKAYFARRVVRTLRRMGTLASPMYTKYATDILLSFDDKRDFVQPEKFVKTSYVYNSQTGGYSTFEKVTWYDSYASFGSLYYILYGQSSRYILKPKRTRWECVPPYTPGATFDPMREEAFATLWNKAPEDIIRLLSKSCCERVSQFACFVFRNNAAFKTHITETHLIEFLKNPSLQVQLLAFELVRDFFETKTPSSALIAALLLSQPEDARLYAQQCIDKEPLRFCNDTELLLILLQNHDPASHQWLQQFLLRHKAQASTQKEVLNRFLLSGFPADEKYIRSVTDVIETCFAEAIHELDPALIFTLLKSQDVYIQGFAGRLLVLRRVSPGLVPDQIIFSLLESESKMARKAAIDLLNLVDDKALLEKQSLILSLCLSPLQDVRQAAQSLIDRLLIIEPEAGPGLINLFIPVLTVKEKYEGLHQDILGLISNKLITYLKHSSTKQILSLCTSRYLASQELGNMLLLQSNHTFSIRELNQLAGSALMRNRDFVKQYYSNNIQRIREEKKETIMLVDNGWGDVRQFGFEYFRKHFSEQDWQPELFIALCDSIHEEVQAFGREMITRWFEKDNGFDYLLRLSQHPDSRMQLFASGFLDRYARNNHEMLKKLSDFLILLLSQVNKGRIAKTRAVRLLSEEALKQEENAALIAIIFNRMSATASVQDKALYIEAMLRMAKVFPGVQLLLQIHDTPVYSSKRHNHAVQL